MSKVKNPQEKKSKSLKLDRRNCYGESPHASRKNIARGKKTQHQQERRAANSRIPEMLKNATPEEFEETEGEIKVNTRIKRISGFKKQPDRSLSEALARKAKYRKSNILE